MNISFLVTTFLLFLVGKCSTQGNLSIFQRCKSSEDCQSNCCGFDTNPSHSAFICLSKCQKLIINSKCDKSDICDSSCCYNEKCSEFDICFTQNYLPLVYYSVILVGACIGIGIFICFSCVVYSGWAICSHTLLIRKFRAHEDSNVVQALEAFLQ